MKAACLALLVCVGLTPSAFAQDVSVTLRTDGARVAVGQSFRLEIRAEASDGQVQNLEPPALEAFDVVGRQQSFSAGFSFSFGGKTTRIKQPTVQTLTLVARKPGTYTVGPAIARHYGKTYASNTLTIEVVGEAAAPDAPPASVDVDGVQSDANAFLQARVDKTEAVVGEQVTVQATLYTRRPLAQPLSIHRELQVTGAWTQNLIPDGTQPQPRQVQVGNEYYYAYELKRLAAFALKEGTMTIEPMSLEGVTAERRGLRARYHPVEATSDTLQVSVSPIPGASGDDDVAVGDFKLDAKLDRTTLATGDAATLTATVSGTGALSTIRLTPTFAPGLRALKPTIDENIDIQGDRVGGSKTFRWIVVAEEPGTHAVDVSLKKYDPATPAAVEVLRVPPLTIEAAGKAVPPVAGQDTQAASEDRETARQVVQPAARAIGAQPPESKSLLAQTVTQLLLGAALLFFAGALGLRWQHGRQRGGKTDPWASVTQSIDNAASALTDKDNGHAVAELERALRAALDAAVGEPTGGLSSDELHDVLTSSALDSNDVEEALRVQQQIAFARFTPGTADGAALLGSVRSLVSRLKKSSARKANGDEAKGSQR